MMTMTTKRMTSLRMETNSLRIRTTKKRTIKRTSRMFLQFVRHPLPPFDHLITRRIQFLAMLMFVAARGAVPGLAAGDEKHSGSHAHDFIIFASVFTEKGFALSGAKVR